MQISSVEKLKCLIVTIATIELACDAQKIERRRVEIREEIVATGPYDIALDAIHKCRKQIPEIEPFIVDAEPKLNAARRRQ